MYLYNKTFYNICIQVVISCIKLYFIIHVLFFYVSVPVNKLESKITSNIGLSVSLVMGLKQWLDMPRSQSSIPRGGRSTFSSNRLNVRRLSSEKILESLRYRHLIYQSQNMLLPVIESDRRCIPVYLSFQSIFPTCATILKCVQLYLGLDLWRYTTPVFKYHQYTSDPLLRASVLQSFYSVKKMVQHKFYVCIIFIFSLSGEKLKVG